MSKGFRAVIIVDENGKETEAFYDPERQLIFTNWYSKQFLNKFRNCTIHEFVPGRDSKKGEEIK